MDLFHNGGHRREEFVREHQSEAIARPTKEERQEHAIRNNQSLLAFKIFLIYFCYFSLNYLESFPEIVNFNHTRNHCPKMGRYSG